MSVYYNENDPYCCNVLRARIADGSLPKGFVDEKDIRLVKAQDLTGYVQCHFFAGIGGIPLGLKWAGAERLPIWTGGFPCQDISMAGDRAGIDGERSGLWGEWFRLIREVRPRYILVENVSALLVPIDGQTPAPISRVLGDLSSCWYDAEWDCIPACAVGAPHERDRVWIVAYSASGVRAGKHGRGGSALGLAGCGKALANPTGERCSRPRVFAEWSGPKANAEGKAVDAVAGGFGGKWCAEPNVGRVANGVPSRMDRLKGLGNSVVPQVVEQIGRAILRAELEAV